ncbi:MAG: enoyl-CoA hydratase/isomerase family protein [Deltaproteobacteria bacterium]|nr:enoyl-CoA hydratase/isomerase family protein [Deltaproteobacteria bacterium]
MQDNQSYTVDDILFKARKEENVIVLNIKNNLLQKATDLSAKELLFEYLRRVSDDDGIKVILIIGAHDKTGREEYLRFYRNILTTKINPENLERLYNAVNQFIKRIVCIDKMVVHADSGKVISLFMNISLACDYRIIGDNTVFQNAYHEIGLMPKGGGAFFLSKISGSGKAAEIMLRDDDISAEEALAYGIVNRIVPSDDLEKEAIKTARKLSRIQLQTLSGIKKLLNYSIDELDKCLELENHELRKIIRSSGFRKILER